MPLTDWELWACAQEALQQMGGRAPVHAAERIAVLRAAGDEDGAHTWTLIADRINQLRDFGKAHWRKPH